MQLETDISIAHDVPVVLTCSAEESRQDIDINITPLIDAAAFLHWSCFPDSEARSRSQSISPLPSSSTQLSPTQPLHMPLFAPVSLGPTLPGWAPSPATPSATMTSVAFGPPLPPIQASQTAIQESINVMTDEYYFSIIMEDFSADTVIMFPDRLMRRMADSMPDNEEFHLPFYQKNSSMPFTFNPSPVFTYLTLRCRLSIFCRCTQNTRAT